MMYLLALMIVLCALALLFFLSRNIEIELLIRIDSTYGITLRLKIGLFFGLIPIKFGGLVCRDAVENWVVIIRMGKRNLRTVGIKELLSKLILPKRKEKKQKINMVKLSSHIEVGVEDAAQCALACGGLKMLIEMVFAVIAQENTQIVVTAAPLYNQSRIRMNLAGIFKVKSEQIIVNLVKLQVKKAKGR